MYLLCNVRVFNSCSVFNQCTCLEESLSMIGTEFFSFFKAYVGVLSSGESLLYPQVALSSAGYAVLNLHDNGQISYNVSSCIDIKKKSLCLEMHSIHWLIFNHQIARLYDVVIPL